MEKSDVTTPSTNQMVAGWWSRRRAVTLVLAAFTVLAFYLCYLMAVPFLPALSWALALAVISRPLHTAVVGLVSNRDVATGITVVALALIVVGPVTWVVSQVVREAVDGVEKIQEQTQTGQWQEALADVPWLGPHLASMMERTDLSEQVQQAVLRVVGDPSTLMSNIVWTGMQMLITVFTLYYFLRDRHRVLAEIRSLLPLSDKEADVLFRRVDDTIHATIYGSVVVAMVQGFMGGLMFALLGLPAPLTWGTVMGILALVPNLGTFVIWAPAAAFLALAGNWGKAVILVAWGCVAIATIDNLLYPHLVGSRLRLHPLLVFFAILGGLIVFGAAGVILGPVIVAITDALIDVWRRRTAGGRTAEISAPPPTT